MRFQAIENITNELATGQGLSFDIVTAYNSILAYCKATKTVTHPCVNSYEVNNGVLYINGAPVERVAILAPRVNVSETADYYEGRILAREGL